MAKKSRRSVSRKMKRTLRRKASQKRDKRTRKNKRTQGGEAPVNYHLAGNWSSRMSMGQGTDYLKYHVGQHGGALGGAPLSAIGQTLPSELAGPAHITGTLNAYRDIQGLCDPPNCPGTGPAKVGGKRHKKRGNKSRKGHKKSRKGAKKTRKGLKGRKSLRNKKRKGGSLGFAPFPSQGMLLDSAKAYAQAGLNPEWKTDVAFTDAKIRDSQ